MRRRWGRWRGYADELEELMRAAGEHLAEVEALIAEAWERSTWRGRQRASIDGEILRRALDVPFLGDLVRTAWRLGPDADLSPPDFEGRPWRDGEAQSVLASASRGERREAVAGVPPDGEERPPARLRAAERALRDRTRSLVVVLDDLVGARNASAVVRTAEALGLQEVHLVQQEGRVALERTVTTLAERWVDLHWYPRAAPVLDGLRARGYRIWVADYGQDAVPLSAVPAQDRMALVFGSEQRGVSEATRAHADGCFFLPSAGFTSYVNVSVMAGIALHDVDARLRAAGLRRPLEPDDRARLRRAWYTLLARGDPERTRRYLGWAERPVEPAPPRGPRPARGGARAVDGEPRPMRRA
jgi:tRNA (guanosine-2'-O-)-methyltransferase